MNQSKHLPDKIKIIRHTEVWEPGCTLILIDGMYKSLMGCVFGLSIERVTRAISAGDAIEIPKNTPNYI